MYTINSMFDDKGVGDRGGNLEVFSRRRFGAFRFAQAEIARTQRNSYTAVVVAAAAVKVVVVLQ